MGTPRKQRRKYERPAHPWNMERITAERELCVKYGLKNKKELWKVKSRLGRIRDQAKRLLVLKGEEADKDRGQLISKINFWGIKASSIDDILALEATSLLERRLQSVLVGKGLVASPRLARQLIVHNHVYVGSHKVSIPSYMVLAKEDNLVRIEDGIKIEDGKKAEKLEDVKKVEQSVREETKEAG